VLEVVHDQQQALVADGAKHGLPGVAAMHGHIERRGKRRHNLRGGGQVSQSGDRLGARVRADGSVRLYKNAMLLGTVTLSAADQAFFNGRGGKIGVGAIGASNAYLDDFGGGTSP